MGDAALLPIDSDSYGATFLRRMRRRSDEQLRNFLVRGPDGSLNHDRYRDNALNARSAYLGELISAVPEFSPATKRRLSLFAAAFMVATGAFWATMLTDPPTTEASATGSFSIGEVLAKASRELPVQQTDAF